ncbi:DUF368 domain-containing protein [Methanobrevibacter sp. DSM 116169]|uniref:DUF368 domain-containing protein n=1 Tax=Methanobrevibacter sp. DSM 116169 TaxID=3242727 RepID=UPI0038FC4C5E
MGAADIVPGVSGGTIALITGIYERLVHSISKINFKFLKPLFKGNFSGFKDEFLDEIDFGLFIPLLLGIGIAMLTLAKLVTYAMEVHTALTYSFFIGLILASSYILFTKLSEISLKNILFAIAGFILGLVFVSINPIAATHTLPVIFISGMIAICAMILPGISGSFLLLILGQYHYMLTALHEMRLPEVITFCVGALIGILGFSKLLNYLIEHYEEITMALLIGVMIGSLKIPLVEVSSSMPLTILNIVPCVICAVIGLLIIIILEKKL